MKFLLVLMILLVETQIEEVGEEVLEAQIVEVQVAEDDEEVEIVGKVFY